MVPMEEMGSGIMKKGFLQADSYREVYSTEVGEICPECHKPRPKCECHSLKKQSILGDGKVKIRFESKGRGGKSVTVVTGLALTEDDLSALLKKIKTECSVGGTVKEGVLEVQGDKRTQVDKVLQSQGYKPKLL